MEFLKAYMDWIILGILGIMAFLALWCVIERLLFFRKINMNEYQNHQEFDNALSENLTTLYIIYSNAPYVGLLGTVVGIMIVFYDMGFSGNIDVKSIVVGLSLALKATALGLLVAIPSLMAYNALLRKISILSSRYQNKDAKND
ncbi:TonB-system energizer ExbB [Campylobacter sp. MIT 97-5078]|uniref:TonB-system energizer ExbB n=1 Tax=Campylobacter sp. MIT 97-5078 TaxID=1548153 RepID=UPI000513B0D5|nr:TonB-system energizer ExbB [Campylobacter sp. MIT 97-5078]KGI56183.1 biopolymer transporter ExbB [Campylobacter sp. MIT 97-5078]TQR25532.1 TonB-system energizer ExbB [Campylobacter sp. MIT 97-5078]